MDSTNVALVAVASRAVDGRTHITANTLKDMALKVVEALVEPLEPL